MKYVLILVGLFAVICSSPQSVPTHDEIVITDSEEVTMQKRLRICQSAITGDLDDPRSADFPPNWRTGHLSDDHVILRTTFRAKNHFGAIQKMDGFCEFRPTQSSEELIIATSEFLG